MSEHVGSPREIGFEGIEAEHQVELALLTTVTAAVTKGRASDEVTTALDQLVEYTNAHFLSEQLLMRWHSYPGYDAHVLEHDRAIELLRDLQERHRAGEVRLTLDVLADLRGWLVGHIHGQDAALATYLADRGLASTSSP